MQNVKQQDNQSKKLSKRHLYTFGLGDFGFNAMMCMETNFFSAFLTDYARFPLALAGIIMTITSIADTIASLLAGVILQKSKINIKDSGKYRSWLLFGPPIVAIFYIIQFSKVGSNNLSAAVICSGYIISHLICAIVYTAYISLLGKMSSIQSERTTLSINKAQWNSAANIIFSYTAMTLVSFIAVRTTPVLGYTFTTAFWAILMVLSFWYIFTLSKGKDVEEVSTNQSNDKASSPSTIELLKLTGKNKPLLGLVGAEILRNTATFLMIGTAFYYFKYVLQDLNFLPIYLSIVAIMQFIGTLIVPKVANKFSKRQSYIIGMDRIRNMLICSKILRCNFSMDIHSINILCTINI
ncbi:MFS transporter [Intestinibacter sp.]